MTHSFGANCFWLIISLITDGREQTGRDVVNVKDSKGETYGNEIPPSFNCVAEV